MEAVAMPNDAQFLESRAACRELEEFLRSDEAAEMTHSRLEREVSERGREVLRQLLQAHIRLRGVGRAVEEVRGADGVRRDEERIHNRTLGTVLGNVEVERIGYWAHGVESLHPLDADLNLPAERYSHELRRRMSEEASKVSFEEARASVERSTGTAVPKRQVEELVKRAAVDFDTFYEQRRVDSSETEASGPIMVLSADGKGIVMRHADLREATQKAAEKTEHKMKKRLSKGEKRNRKRMATVATVYTIAAWPRTVAEVTRTMAPIRDAEQKGRPRPENKRVWASIEKSAEEVIAAAFEEARSRDPDLKMTWVALVDGNDQQLRMLRKFAKKHGVQLTVILDIMHVVEYLWKAATVFNDEGTPETEAWVTQRLESILHGRAPWVAAGIRRSATLRDLDPKDRKPADSCAKYLLNHKKYLHYDQYLKAGFPIATGVIEGACRHLVNDRMDLTGARWSLSGAEAVLRLRALRSSGDFDCYWEYHERREFERNHPTQYYAGRIPMILSPIGTNGRTHLKVVE